PTSICNKPMSTMCVPLVTSGRSGSIVSCACDAVGTTTHAAVAMTWTMRQRMSFRARLFLLLRPLHPRRGIRHIQALILHSHLEGTLARRPHDSTHGPAADASGRETVAAAVRDAARASAAGGTPMVYGLLQGEDARRPLEIVPGGQRRERVVPDGDVV